MKNLSAKDPVKLRRRILKSGNTSLYLDIYIKGKRTYEYLNLYLLPGTGRAVKQKNEETLSLAEAVRAKRVVEVRNGTYGFTNSEKRQFVAYYEERQNRFAHTDNNNTWHTWNSALYWLKNYDSKLDSRTLDDITPQWLQGLIDYMSKSDSGLAKNTVHVYFQKVRACLNQAFRDGLIASNPCRLIRGPKRIESERPYLTLEELQKLNDAPCKRDDVRRAFLFSCLTGLRHSDIIGLTWADVKSGERTRIMFRQKKTKGFEYLDLSEEAAALLGERGKPEEHPFGRLSLNKTNYHLVVWVARAGIDKDITFHCGRHTFAVLSLELGVDIFTVSKLLGHRNLSTTQIYAKIVDRRKQEAVDKIGSLLAKK